MDAVGELEQPAVEDLDLVEVLQALGDPVRLQIVRYLASIDEPIACHAIPIPVSKSTGSHHLKVLREAGIVHTEVVGTRKYPSLRREELEARFPGLLDSVLRAKAPDGGSPTRRGRG
jgi:DNA-binding transcriptional ArsR family regulator